jgi:hypothetical protein
VPVQIGTLKSKALAGNSTAATYCVFLLLRAAQHCIFTFKVYAVVLDDVTTTYY